MKKTVFVGLSGGVDSAVSAAVLIKQGYEVVGVFIKTWHPKFLPCNEEEERRDAMRVAAHLDIPFLTFDLENVYKKEVADYMISEYRAGRTPNPDVMCNKEVKFGAFLRKALSMGADYVATGHYVQKIPSQNFSALLQPKAGTFRHQNSVREFFMVKSNDLTKDQSYFLWTLSQKQLAKIIFPIGHLRKQGVRKLARKFKIPVAEKKDSQGICFLGDVDLKKFLKHYIKEKKGKVLNEKGEVIGHHNGVVFHTLGERHGFTITKKGPSDARYYIVGKNVKKNILIVSNDIPRDISREVPRDLKLKNTNWVSEIPKDNKTYTAQVRYHGELLECKIEIWSRSKAKIIFQKSVLAASGQSCIIYDGSVCLGGGIII